MTLSELKAAVDDAIERAAENGEHADEILVSIQIDTCDNSTISKLCDDVELCYDHNALCSGCVIFGEMTGEG